MHKILMFSLTILATSSFAQTQLTKQSVDRRGFVLGIGDGAGALALNVNETKNLMFSTTIPNLKLGFMLNKKLALMASFPGATYNEKSKTRGFEGVVVVGQYWINERLWLNGGTGLTFDAPAFYTVKNPKEAAFYTGVPAITFASGYEIWQKGRFALDLQYRFFYGSSNLSSDVQRKGVANMLIIGLNWY